jgi:site-specific recombinase XerD
MGVAKKTENEPNFPLQDEFFENFTSVHTRDNYRNDLLKFFEFLVESFPKIKNLKTVERKQIIAYRNFLSETGGRDAGPCAPKTVARKLACLSSYFDFLVESGKRDFNPVKSVKRPREKSLNPPRP